MKPIAQLNDRRGSSDFLSNGQSGRFPLIEWSYQQFSLDRSYGGSGDSRPSFLNISRDYFRYEARRDFLAEVAFFLVMAAILASAFVEGARVIIHTLQLPPA
jgi:hypothetical protein